MFRRKKHPVLGTPKPRNHRRPWIRWKDELGEEGCPYLVRWFVDLRLFSIRVHHFIGSDDSRALHDHGWGFVTVILKGWYDDVGETKTERMKPGMIRYRPATHKHTVQVGEEGAWTIIFTGPRIRNWGYWVEGKFRKVNKYYKMFGHHKPTHPCSDGTGREDGTK